MKLFYNLMISLPFISKISSLFNGHLFLKCYNSNILSRSVKSSNLDVTVTKDASNQFENLGLIPELVAALSAQGLVIPTPVQKTVIPRLLNGENLVMAASTGSGKTFAYLLPAAQQLRAQEMTGYTRLVRRPRCLVLVPTRELAKQVLAAVKSLSHYCKLSSTTVIGGEDFVLQKKALDREVDILVGSPERVVQHKDKGNLYLSQVTHVVIDEVDTMLTQGFGSDIRAILRSVLNRNTSLIQSSDIGTKPPQTQLVMASATLTKAVKALLTDVDGAFNIEFNDPANLTPRKARSDDARVHMKIVEVDGVHRTLPHVKHDSLEVKGVDKLAVLKEVLARYDSKKYRTMIFCNTIVSSRAVDYALTESGREVQSYHGDLNSKERSDGLDRFRSGERQYLVCTDIAARGIDIPEVDHIVMFDFPLNSIDYLHRAGRCGRAGRKGLVTALVTKRDKILSDAIQGAIARGLPIDELTSSKRDYQDRGKLAEVVGRKSRAEASAITKRRSRILSRSSILASSSSSSIKGVNTLTKTSPSIIKKMDTRPNRPISGTIVKSKLREKGLRSNVSSNLNKSVSAKVHSGVGMGSVTKRPRSAMDARIRKQTKQREEQEEIQQAASTQSPLKPSRTNQRQTMGRKNRSSRPTLSFNSAAVEKRSSVKRKLK